MARNDLCTISHLNAPSSLWDLPDTQRNHVGQRHRCAACAYDLGYNDALAIAGELASAAVADAIRRLRR